MKTLKINISNIESTFNSLKNECKGHLKRNGSEMKMVMDNDIGNGEVTGFTFNNNILYLTYGIKFSEDTTMIFDDNINEQSLNYCYCSSGEMRHSFGETGKMLSFSEMQTGIFSNSMDKPNLLYFQKNQYQKFTLISFVANKTTLKNTDEYTWQLMQLFKAKEKSGRFAYASSYNVKIQETLNQIDLLSGKNIADALLKKGMLQVSLAMIVNQYFEDMEKQQEGGHTLSQGEMESIKEISEFIRNYPDQQFDLNYLSKKTGLTPAKLQQGFKDLFGRTVSNFIKNVRVELAEKLIKTTDLNISQIVYTIGLSSRSYFSKIFKEKYKCSPREYQNNRVHMEVLAK